MPNNQLNNNFKNYQFDDQLLFCIYVYIELLSHRIIICLMILRTHVGLHKHNVKIVGNIAPDFLSSSDKRLSVTFIS